MILLNNLSMIWCLKLTMRDLEFFTISHSSIEQHLWHLLKLVSSKLREIEFNSNMHRLKFFQNKLHSTYSTNSKKDIKALWNIYRSEIRRYAFQKLTLIIKEVAIKSFDHVILPSLTGPCSVVDGNKLHSVVLQRNQRHFYQASVTPFSTPLSSNFYKPFHQNPGKPIWYLMEISPTLLHKINSSKISCKAFVKFLILQTLICICQMKIL